MATGMEMMLKTLGFDPEKLKAEFQQHADRFIHALEEANTKMARIEKKLDIVLQHEGYEPEVIADGSSADHNSAGSGSGGN